MACSVIITNLYPGKRIKHSFKLKVDYYNDHADDATIVAICSTSFPARVVVPPGSDTVTLDIYHFEDDSDHFCTASLQYNTISCAADVVTGIIVDDLNGSGTAPPYRDVHTNVVFPTDYKFPNALNAKRFSANTKSIVIEVFRYESMNIKLLDKIAINSFAKDQWKMTAPFKVPPFSLGATLLIRVRECEELDGMKPTKTKYERKVIVKDA